MRLDIDIGKDKIAYLIVCTSRYKELFAGFYESFRKYFDDDLYVLTEDTAYFSQYAVTPLYIEHLPWPGIVMKKFSNILKYSDVFRKYDKIVCFQANMRFVRQLKLQFNSLLFCFHPYGSSHNDYVCGGLVGGSVDQFIAMCSACDDWLTKHPDAKWHDETALNWYWNNNAKDATVLSKHTIYVEGDTDRSKNPISAIMVLNKDKFFGASKKQYAS